MEDNISEMLKSVMSDPETMSKLMSVAQGLTGGSDKQSPPPEDPPKKEPEVKASLLTKGNEERIALISAIRPYLSPERRKSADSMIKMLKMMKLTDLSKMLGNL